MEGDFQKIHEKMVEENTNKNTIKERRRRTMVKLEEMEGRREKITSPTRPFTVVLSLKGIEGKKPFFTKRERPLSRPAYNAQRLAAQ